MLTFDLFLALAGFALATLYTPGPNNLMLMASGANYGLRRTVPHLLGVALGFPVLAICVGLGLAAAFEAFVNENTETNRAIPEEAGLAQ